MFQFRQACCSRRSKRGCTRKARTRENGGGDASPPPDIPKTDSVLNFKQGQSVSGLRYHLLLAFFAALVKSRRGDPEATVRDTVRSNITALENQRLNQKSLEESNFRSKLCEIYLISTILDKTLVLFRQNRCSI